MTGKTKWLTAFTGVILATSVVLAQPQPCRQPQINISEHEEVIYRYQTDRCNDRDIPDVPAAAFIDKDNLVQLLDSNSQGNYRSVGTSLSTLKRDCSSPVLTSKFNAPPENFYNRVWLTDPWTNDGQTIYAFVHNEFQGWKTQPEKYCPTGNQETCWYPNVVAAISRDAGKTYQIMQDSTGQSQIIVATPYPYEPDGGGPGNHQGIPIQTNVLSKKSDNGTMEYYMLAQMSVGHDVAPGTCLFRSHDVTDPSAWRGWDGNDFTVAMNTHPYQAKNQFNPQVCTPIFRQPYCHSWTFNTVLQQYIAICEAHPGDGGNAFVYITTKNMLHWSEPTLLKKTIWLNEWGNSTVGSGVEGQAYPSMLDSTSTGRNFEYSGAHPYLYYTRLNPKKRGARGMDRDLVRVQMDVKCQ